MTRTVASAPGKLVLLGEYAVLEGAPALVLAVNRRARVTLDDAAGDAWEIVSPTLHCTARLRLAAGRAEWQGAAPAELAWVARVLEMQPAVLPACRIELASDTFYFDHAGARTKLGLGSSAALTVALLGALAARAGTPTPNVTRAIATHRAIQHGRGSGIDIAASLSGGLLRFELASDGATVTPLALPHGIHWRCVYSGRATSTSAMLAQVAAWRAREPTAYRRRQAELATLSARGVDAVAANDAAAFLSAVQAYASALARFGEAAGADIASREHRAIGTIAAGCGCCYKSCGAGGGDVGITFSVDDSRLQEFSARTSAAGFPVIELQADPAGLAVASTK